MIEATERAATGPLPHGAPEAPALQVAPATPTPANDNADEPPLPPSTLPEAGALFGAPYEPLATKAWWLP